jgi:hypothetical protein
MKVIVNLGPELFQFGSFSGWVNHAQRAWKQIGVKSSDTICLDAQDRPCWIGRDFMKARDEGTFPVRVFLLRGDLAEYQHLTEPEIADEPAPEPDTLTADLFSGQEGS